MIFESHAHFDDDAFDTDREQLLKQIYESGVTKIVNVAASLSSVKTTLELAGQHSFIYGALGIHPSDTDELDEESAAWLKECCREEKVVAVGEIGLDYYWDNVPKDVQQKWFRRQLQMANEVNLPVIIHSRDAAKDTLDIMREEEPIKKGGVIHCYSYTKEMARDFLNMDYYFGVGGVITFKNGRKLREAVEYIPMDRILLETDSPYLAPEPFRGKRNCSLYLPYVVDQIALIKGISKEDVMEQTMKNANRLFGLQE